MTGTENVRREAFEFESRPGEVVRGDLWTPAHDLNGYPHTAVAICHGFKGFKDWGFFPHAGRELASTLGCRTVTFNFAGSGIGPGLMEFTEPEAFGHNTFGREIGDLDAVLDGLEAGRLGAVRSPSIARLGLIGHSRGAVAAILAGERSTVRAVCTWAGIAAAERYLAPFDGLAPGEPSRIVNTRTGDVLLLYDDVKREILGDPDRFDLLASLRRSAIPLLVVHGSDDTAVPVADAHQLASVDSARLALVKGAGHTFEVSHPFAGPTPEFERVLAMSAEHFRSHLLTE